MQGIQEIDLKFQNSYENILKKAISTYEIIHLEKNETKQTKFARLIENYYQAITKRKKLKKEINNLDKRIKDLIKNSWRIKKQKEKPTYSNGDYLVSSEIEYLEAQCFGRLEGLKNIMASFREKVHSQLRLVSAEKQNSLLSIEIFLAQFFNSKKLEYSHHENQKPNQLNPICCLINDIFLLESKYSSLQKETTVNYLSNQNEMTSFLTESEENECEEQSKKKTQKYLVNWIQKITLILTNMNYIEELLFLYYTVINSPSSTKFVENLIQNPKIWTIDSANIFLIIFKLLQKTLKKKQSANLNMIKSKKNILPLEIPIAEKSRIDINSRSIKAPLSQFETSFFTVVHLIPFEHFFLFIFTKQSHFSILEVVQITSTILRLCELGVQVLKDELNLLQLSKLIYQSISELANYLSRQPIDKIPNTHYSKQTIIDHFMLFGIKTVLDCPLLILRPLLINFPYNVVSGDALWKIFLLFYNGEFSPKLEIKTFKQWEQFTIGETKRSSNLMISHIQTKPREQFITSLENNGDFVIYSMGK
ncbi:hypothetical protein M0811_00969 [Anaeramoeba ignava]|uniref:Uncharacterized protein n=1 Tax=Anaeramoeba ignava TaxID=1746090 RepID=A0A9Q0LM77_ANAIG|nr:hypothetical protein M0811_00969 [Anaeramoeba ignava]